MTHERVQQQLVAVLAADVAGFAVNREGGGETSDHQAGFEKEEQIGKCNLLLTGGIR